MIPRKDSRTESLPPSPRDESPCTAGDTDTPPRLQANQDTGRIRPSQLIRTRRQAVTRTPGGLERRNAFKGNAQPDTTSSKATVQDMRPMSLVSNTTLRPVVESPTGNETEDVDRMQRLFDEMQAEGSTIDEMNPYEAFTVKTADPAARTQTSASDGPVQTASQPGELPAAPKSSGHKRVLPKMPGLQLKLSRLASALPGLKDAGAEKKHTVDVRLADHTPNWTREEMALRHVGHAVSQMTVMLAVAMPQGKDLDELKQVLEQVAGSGMKPLDQAIRTDELVDAGLNHFFTRWIDEQGLLPDAMVSLKDTVLPDLVLQARCTLMEFVSQGAFPDLVQARPDQDMHADHESIMGAIRNALARKLAAMFPVLPALNDCVDGLAWPDLVHLAEAQPAVFAKRFGPLRDHFAAHALDQSDHERARHLIAEPLATLIQSRDHLELRRLTPETELADLVWHPVNAAYGRLLDLRLTDVEVRDLKLLAAALQQRIQAQATSHERAQQVDGLAKALLTQVLRLYLRVTLPRQMAAYVEQAFHNLSRKLDGVAQIRNRLANVLDILIDLLVGGFNDGDCRDPVPALPAKYDKYELPEDPDPRIASYVQYLREAQARQPEQPEPEPRFGADRARVMKETSAQLRSRLLAQLSQ